MYFLGRLGILVVSLYDIYSAGKPPERKSGAVLSIDHSLARGTEDFDVGFAAGYQFPVLKCHVKSIAGHVNNARAFLTDVCVLILIAISIYNGNGKAIIILVKIWNGERIGVTCLKQIIG